MIIQALRKGLIEHEASDTGGVPGWKSSCPDRLAEATGGIVTVSLIRGHTHSIREYTLYRRPPERSEHGIRRPRI